MYSGPGIYLIHFADPNHNSNIVNIAHSVSQPFYVETELVVNAFTCIPNSPHPFLLPVNNARIGTDFSLAMTAFDYERDSLHYEFVNPKSALGTFIPGYTFPAGCTINPGSGEILWLGDSMTTVGEFCLVVKTEKWRKLTNGTLFTWAT